MGAMTAPRAVPPAVTRLRLPRSALVAVAVLAVCTLPLASADPRLGLLFVIPALVGLYVWRSGVDVSDTGVTIRAAFGARRIAWEQVAGLQVRGRGELWLTRTDGTAVRLPVLRSPRDLARLHAASGGRLGVPGA